MSRQTVTPLRDRFMAYLEREPCWGALNVVLDDGNYDDDCALCCLTTARKYDDEEAVALAEIVVSLSVWDRCRLRRVTQ